MGTRPAIPHGELYAAPAELNQLDLIDYNIMT
jgi:hypothetical protein